MIIFLVIHTIGMSMSLFLGGYPVGKLDAIASILIAGFIAVIHTINKKRETE